MLKSASWARTRATSTRSSGKIKQFGAPGRQGGGVCGVEMALMDLAGKAYGVPRLRAGRRQVPRPRPHVCRHPDGADPKGMAEQLKERMDRGFTMLKMDLGIGLIGSTGALTWPQGTAGRPRGSRGS